MIDQRFCVTDLHRIIGKNGKVGEWVNDKCPRERIIRPCRRDIRAEKRRKKARIGWIKHSAFAHVTIKLDHNCSIGTRTDGSIFRGNILDKVTTRKTGRVIVENNAHNHTIIQDSVDRIGERDRKNFIRYSESIATDSNIDIDSSRRRNYGKAARFVYEIGGAAA